VFVDNSQENVVPLIIRTRTRT